ncbi:MAG TPA: phosphatase PAP2 family protein, partial [Candidatus Deferrimicrobium sp.]|nr:phosphatase PAP2 family protein [Candidatus Deferrimicrobium sp.]
MNAGRVAKPRSDALDPAARPAGPSAETAPAVDPPRTPGRHGVAELVIGFAIALASMFVFAFIADRVYLQEQFALDTVANPFLHSISSPTLDAVMTGITDLGSGPGLGILFGIALATLLVRRRRAMALFLVVALGGSVALNGIMKLSVERPRPILPCAKVLPDYSFPSGHTMNSLVFLLALALIVWATFGRRRGAIAVTAAILVTAAIGFS